MLSRLGALHLPKKMTVPRPSSLKKKNPKKPKQQGRKQRAYKRESFSFGAVVFLVARMLLEGERFIGGWIKPILLKAIEDSVSWLRAQLLKQSWEESQGV